LPDTVIGPPPNCPFAPPASKIGVALKVKDAGLRGAPKLQIATTGLTIGEANVTVLLPVNAPSKVMMSPTVLGEEVTVPPINELFDDQLIAVPLNHLIAQYLS